MALSIANKYPKSLLGISLFHSTAFADPKEKRRNREKSISFIQRHGVEPFVNSMAKALRQIEEHNLENVRLYDDDAVNILDWLPPSSVDRIDLLYPDPWPKTRHWKRRFVNQKNLNRFSKVLTPTGTFHFASDIESYVNWTLQHCDRHANFSVSASGESSCPASEPTRLRRNE